MYILHNAVKNIFRNKGRNILIGVIVFAIITTTVIALSINNTSKGIISEYKDQFGAEVFLTPDMDKFASGNGEKTSMLTVDQYMKYADSKYIKEFHMTMTQELESIDLKAVDEVPLEDGLEIGNDDIGEGDPYIHAQMLLKANIWDDFNSGTRKVVDGKMVEKANECLISQELAELNDLSVGDKVLFKASAFTSDGTFRTIPYEFTISGIYLDASDPYTGGSRHFTQNRRNEIFTMAESITDAINSGEFVDATVRYFLKNPSMLDDYEAELRDKGLSDLYNLKTDEAGYKKVVGPVEGLRSISITFMVIVLILGAIILILLSSIAIRERKYEIGVLRAMGMKKKKVAFGLWLETSIITLMCLFIGLGVGATISQPITNTLLAGQIENAKAAKNADQLGGQYYIAGVGSNETDSSLTPLEELDVSVELDTILEICVIALILATISSMVAIKKIMKYEPIKILMERN